MSWLGKLFGTEKAVNSIVDKDNGLLVRAGTALGNLHYSDQEKAQDALKVREFGLRQLEALHPFKVTQRILAFSVMFIWALVAINFMAMLWIGHEGRGELLEFAFSDYVFWPTLSVLSLYTGGGFINSLKGGK